AVAAAQDARALGLSGARPREADMGVHRDPVALGIGGVVRVVVLLGAPERRAGPLVAPDHELLLLARHAVPELDAVADDADHLVGAARGPRRLAGARPHDPVHDAPVGGRRIRR